MKEILNKWQIHFFFGRDFRTLERGWKRLEFGIFKIIKFPEENEMLWNKYYNGFFWRFKIWIPIDFDY